MKHTKKRHITKEDFVILAMAVAIIFIVFTHLFLRIEISKAATYDTTTVSVVKKDQEMQPLKPIVYETTDLYQEELEQQEKERLQAEQEEFLYLQKLVFVEAQGESMNGKILVAASVVNRKNHPTKFPNTIKEVVEEIVDGIPQYADISYVCEEYINEYSWRKDAWEECGEATERALAGEDPAASFLGGPTLYFYNPDKCSEQQKENRKDILCYTEGKHKFHNTPPMEK